MDIEIYLSKADAERLWQAKEKAGRDDLTAAEFAELLLLKALREAEREQREAKK